MIATTGDMRVDLVELAIQVIAIALLGLIVAQLARIKSSINKLTERMIRGGDDVRRIELQEQLEWKREAEAARKEARDRGIDQAAIDRAINELRYGR